MQILFAFLLTLPFATRFNEITQVDRVCHVITLLVAAAAAGLLIALVSYHRMVFQRDRKGELLRTASRLARAGLVCLLIAMTGAVFLDVSVVINLVIGSLAAAGVAGFCAYLWYVLPVRNDRPK